MLSRCKLLSGQLSNVKSMYSRPQRDCSCPSFDCTKECVPNFACSSPVLSIAFVTEIMSYLVEQCVLCGRGRHIFGCRDVTSGWMGWCEVCNWKWRYYGLYQLSRVTRQQAVNQNQLSEKIMQMCKLQGAEEVCKPFCHIF